MKYVGSFIRQGLSLLAGILITKGIVTPETAGQLVSSGAEVLIGLVSYLIAQVWSIKDKKDN